MKGTSLPARAEIRESARIGVTTRERGVGPVPQLVTRAEALRGRVSLAVVCHQHDVDSACCQLRRAAHHVLEHAVASEVRPSTARP
jgi:hypothetical protein